MLMRTGSRAAVQQARIGNELWGQCLRCCSLWGQGLDFELIAVSDEYADGSGELWITVDMVSLSRW
jgi:hypothetical protein